MTSAAPDRAPRIPFGVKAKPALRQALARWHDDVMAMPTVDPAVVEAIRLRAARHHDCHT